MFTCLVVCFHFQQFVYIISCFVYILWCTFVNDRFWQHCWQSTYLGWRKWHLSTLKWTRKQSGKLTPFGLSVTLSVLMWCLNVTLHLHEERYRANANRQRWRLISICKLLSTLWQKSIFCPWTSKHDLWSYQPILSK